MIVTQLSRRQFLNSQQQQGMSYFNRDETINKSDSFKIREIPHLVSPEKISQLNFSHNEIRSIPFHIVSAVNLQILDLSHNKISTFQHIFFISSLKFINFSHNLVTQLPQEVVNLIEIQNIDLSFNKIKIMSSIKVLKDLFQLRMLQYKGFLEINLEGNEVLKKKGCRQLYSKWKCPSYEEFNQCLNKINTETISRTKKRNAKSVQLPFKEKQSQIIHTNRTVLIPQHPKLTTSFKLNEDNLFLKNHAIKLKPQQMTEKIKLPIASTYSQQLKSSTYQHISNSKEINLGQQLLKALNFKDISILQQDRSDNSNLNDWFQNCLQSLKKLDNAFDLMVNNEDFRTMQHRLKQKLTEESLLAQQLTNITIEAVMSELQDSFSIQREIAYRERAQTIGQKVRLLHKQFIKSLNQKENSPIKLYKPWVLHYRKLKSLVAMVTIKIGLHKQQVARERQIQELVDISPQKSSIPGLKQMKSENIKSSAKRRQFEKLNELLFSKGNEEYLLLSDGKRSNSQKKTCRVQKDEVECDGCLMMKWQANKYKQQLNQLTQQVRILSSQKEISLKRVKELEVFKQKYLSLQMKQKLIIEELQAIQPSTYQNMLLEQAKTIEYMLSIQPLIAADGNAFDRFKSKEMFPTSVCTQKHQIAMNTRLSSNKQPKGNSHEWKNKVSEFTVEVNNEKSTENEVRTSSYFKNKNVITTLNKTSEQQGSEADPNHNASLNKYQNEERDRHKVVVSQFNSQANSFTNSEKKQNDKSKSIDRKKMAEVPQKERKVSHKQSINSKKHKTSSDVILISQNSESKKSIPLKNPKKPQREAFKHQLKQKQQDRKSSFVKQKLINGQQDQAAANMQYDYANANKFGGRIALKGSNQSKKKKQTQSMNKQNKQRSNSISRLVQKCSNKDELDVSKYKDHGYVPIQSLEADNYKKYMQYHLRNNIIQILSKKGNVMPQTYDKKILLLTKSQKLIHKRAESSRSEIPKGDQRLGSNAKVANKVLR